MSVKADSSINQQAHVFHGPVILSNLSETTETIMLSSTKILLCLKIYQAQSVDVCERELDVKKTTTVPQPDTSPIWCRRTVKLKMQAEELKL